MAAGQAQAAAFLARLPRQLSTSLDGTPLSGGEVQRLGLARAFAHAGAARLLVLDDATSSLDTVTEMLVARAIARRAERPDTAHRGTPRDHGRPGGPRRLARRRPDPRPRPARRAVGGPGVPRDLRRSRRSDAGQRRGRRSVLIASSPPAQEGRRVARRVVPCPVAPRGRLWLVARAGDHPVPGRPHHRGPRLARSPRRGRAGRGVRHAAGVPENRHDRRAVPRRPGHGHRGRRPRPPRPALRRADDAPGGDRPGLRRRRARHHLYVRVHRCEHAGRPRHPVARHAAVRRPAAACLGDPAAAAAPPVRRAPARRRPRRGERGG